jgi:hypothetical protein
VIPARSEFPLGLRLDTSTIVGSVQHAVSFDCVREDDSHVPVPPAQVVAVISSALHAVPDRFYLDVTEDQRQTPITCSAMLADGWPGEGLAIGEVTSSARERLHHELRPGAGEMAIGLSTIKYRHELRMKYTPPKDGNTFEEVVTVRTTNPRVKPLAIRIWGVVRAPYEFSPNEIVLYGDQPGQRVTREIGYTFRQPGDGEIQFVRLPPNLECRVLDAGDVRKNLIFTYTLPAKAAVERDEVVLQVGKERKTIRLPMSVYSRIP